MGMYVRVSCMCSVPEEAWGLLELQLHMVGATMLAAGN